MKVRLRLPSSPDRTVRFRRVRPCTENNVVCLRTRFAFPHSLGRRRTLDLLVSYTNGPLQIGQHLVRAFEAGFEIGAKPIDAGVIGAVLSRQFDDLEPQLTRNGYDVRSLVEQFDSKPAEIRQLLRGDLDPGRSQELLDQMRAAGLPT